MTNAEIKSFWESLRQEQIADPTGFETRAKQAEAITGRLDYADNSQKQQQATLSLRELVARRINK